MGWLLNGSTKDAIVGAAKQVPAVVMMLIAFWLFLSHLEQVEERNTEDRSKTLSVVETTSTALGQSSAVIQENTSVLRDLKLILKERMLERNRQ